MRVATVVVGAVVIIALSQGIACAAPAQAAPRAATDIVLLKPTCQTCRVLVTPWGQLGGDGNEGDGRNFMALKVTRNSTILATVFQLNEIWRMDRNG
jgi:hypothetical protein